MKDSLFERKYNHGHRRAFSMPNASAERTSVAVVGNSNLSGAQMKKRYFVRFRPYGHKNKRLETTKTVNNIANGSQIVVPITEDDDADLSVKINEEELVLPSEETAKRSARIAIRRIWEARWKVTNFELLPEWLQDNEYLRTGHRPPLPSFGSCFKSIFSLHTETGNIWTHMYGCMAFIGAAAWFLTRPSTLIQLEEKVVFGTYFVGAIACLGLSFAFHTVQCHSVEVGKLFSKLDYTGISLLIVGSFIPWIYYGFYCRMLPMIIYLSMISFLGIAAVIVSLWDKFAQPRYRPLRASIFIAMGLSSIVPALHILITDGISYLLNELSLLWLILMGVLYISGAVLYATRTPERCFPGKFDLWLQSHQLFHMFVIAAALVHFYGISKTAVRHLEQGSCAEQVLEQYGYEDS
ncbi:unnamed protein product [Thelazia callipaeda]|uniref:Adiponectin receptor protein n=1 Tax=Thelazia callipaeda TaxID=103827 RepID=A0A0N5D2Z7_THECL|nr:unnamed protein product [Thelazia callipaeda]